MQLRLVKRLLRLEANRNSYLPSYQQHYPLTLVGDSQNPRYGHHEPHRPTPKPPTTDWWGAFGGEVSPGEDKFGIMFMGHRRPGVFGALGSAHSTGSYRHLLLRGRGEDGQRLGSSRLWRLSHLRRPLPPELALATTHPLPRHRWRSRHRRQLMAPRQLLKRSEALRMQQRRSLGQQRSYQR